MRLSLCFSNSLHVRWFLPSLCGGGRGVRWWRIFMRWIWDHDRVNHKPSLFLTVTLLSYECLHSSPGWPGEASESCQSEWNLNANKSFFFESLFLFTTKQPKSTWFQPNGVLSLRLSCSFPAFFVYKDFGWFHIEQKTLNTWRLSCLGDVVSFPRSVVGFRKNTGDLPSARGGWRYLWIHWSLGVFVRCEES